MSALPKPIDTPAPTLASVIIERIREGASLEETQQYYKFLREIQADEAKIAFDADFVRLDIPEIPKRGRINLGQGRVQQYARMEDINEVIEPVLRAHGFKLRFHIVEETETALIIEAIVVHRGGHSISTRKKLPLDKSGSKNIVQSYGSTQTYAQRYAATALLNLNLAEDDDGVAAGASGPVSNDQLLWLMAAITQTGSNLDAFCKLYKIELLKDLPADQFEDAKAKLIRKGATP